MKKQRLKVQQMGTKELERLLANSSGTQKSKIQDELTKRGINFG